MSVRGTAASDFAGALVGYGQQCERARGQAQAGRRAGAAGHRACSSRCVLTGSRESLVALRRWGPTPAAAYAAAPHPLPGSARPSIDERGALTFEEVHRRPTRLPASCAGRASANRTTSRSCAATTAASSRRRSPARSSVTGALYLNTAFAGPADHRRAQRVSRPGGGDLRRGVQRASCGRWRSTAALHRLERARSGAAGPLLEELIARERGRRSRSRRREAAAS